MNQVAKFEDSRWSKGAQPFVYRHGAALEFIKPNTELLDVACGDGLFLSLASAKGVKVTGVDISDQAISNARARGIERISKCDVTTEPLPFEDDEFDMVSALDVLEHTLEPEKMLGEIRRVSKGLAVLSVPNFSSLPSRLQCLLGKVPENNRPKKGHAYWFNWPVLNGLLSKTGFELVEVKRNHQGMAIPLVGNIFGLMARIWPNLFALSFVVLIKKK